MPPGIIATHLSIANFSIQESTTLCHSPQPKHENRRQNRPTTTFRLPCSPTPTWSSRQILPFRLARQMDPPHHLRFLEGTIIAAQAVIWFKGASEYLEEILARIDAPRVDELQMTFFNQITFDTSQLFQFISQRPMLKAPKKGHIVFKPEAIFVEFSSRTSGYGVLSVDIPCTASEWQLSSPEQVCANSLHQHFWCVLMTLPWLP